MEGTESSLRSGIGRRATKAHHRCFAFGTLGILSLAHSNNVATHGPLLSAQHFLVSRSVGLHRAAPIVYYAELRRPNS